MDTNIRGYRGDHFSGITVAELKTLLEGLDDDAIVVFTTDYGDYHHTPQALTLRGEAEEFSAKDVIAKSGYSNSGFELIDNDGEDEFPETQEDEDAGDDIQVVVIR